MIMCNDKNVFMIFKELNKFVQNKSKLVKATTINFIADIILKYQNLSNNGIKYLLKLLSSNDNFVSSKIFLILNNIINNNKINRSDKNNYIKIILKTAFE